MIITRFTKSVAYLSVAALFCLLSIWLTVPLHNEQTYMGAYMKAVLFLFLCGCIFLTAALYSHSYLSKKNREHRRDTSFFLIFGLILLIGDIALILLYGGIAMEPDYTSANIAIVLLALLPLPFWIRGIVLAFSNDHKNRAVVQIAACVLAILWVGLIAMGLLLKTNNISGMVSNEASDTTSTSDFGTDYIPPSEE